MNSLTAALKTAQKASDKMAIAMETFLIGMHKPFDVAGDGTGPAICPQCKTDWPCKVTVDSLERRDALQARHDA